MRRRSETDAQGTLPHTRTAMRLLPKVVLPCCVVELKEVAAHALDLISEIVHEAACPVIALRASIEVLFRGLTR